MIDNVVTRLSAQAPSLNGRVQMALDLTELLRSGRAVEASTAYVAPLGLQARSPATGATAFVQSFVEVVGVLLIVTSHDRTGARALDQVRPMIFEVINALAGWEPGGKLGVFALRGARLLSIAGGRMAYQVDFTIEDEVRILS